MTYSRVTVRAFLHFLAFADDAEIHWRKRAYCHMPSMRRRSRVGKPAFKEVST